MKTVGIQINSSEFTLVEVFIQCMGYDEYKRECELDDASDNAMDAK